MKIRPLVSLLWLSIAGVVFAQDAQTVINFEANETTFLESEYRVILTGKVNITSGNLNLLAEKVVVQFNQAENENEDTKLQTVHATGNVRARQGATTVTSDEMDYDEASQIAIFRGHAVVTQGDSKVTSKEVHMNTATGVYELMGRVKGQIRGSF